MLSYEWPWPIWRNMVDLNSVSEEGGVEEKT